MRLSIDKMRISNFKGIRELELDFSSEKTAIYGANGTGKSSIVDAFCWVLYNKDSNGNAPGSDNFREKPLDDTGHEVHNLDTTVELECKLDGKAFDLKRTQRENWVRKRGSANAVYNGNASTYWINGTETALKDFKARIAEIAPDEIFRLVGNLAAFNSQEWKKRREQLLNLSGKDVDEHLLATDKFKPLAAECAERNLTVDEMRKWLADQRKRTATALHMLPIRIDEARKALPDLTDSDIKDAEYIANDCAESIEHMNLLIAQAQAESGGADVASQIATLEQELASITRQTSDRWAEGKWTLERQRDEASNDLRRATDDVNQARKMVENTTNRVSVYEKKRDGLREEYANTKRMKFAWTDTDETRTCPTCGQQMPEEVVQAAKQAAQERFNAEKTRLMADIKQRGSEAAADLKREQETLSEWTQTMQDATKRLEEAQTRRDKVSQAIKEYPTFPDYDSDRRIEDLKNKIIELQAKLKKAPETKVAELLDRKEELKRKLADKQAILARAASGEETKKRITQLEAEQKESGAKLVELEQLIALTDEFVIDRCAALEESINECFPTVRWKLFDTQINGGITDICMCMIPCESGLVAYESANTAAKINADLEIINVLSKHYDVYIPLFVDGAESVNHLNHTDSQLITLSVSTDDKLQIKEA